MVMVETGNGHVQMVLLQLIVSAPHVEWGLVNGLFMLMGQLHVIFIVC